MVLVLGSNRPIERGLLVKQLCQIVATSSCHPSNISNGWPGRNIDKFGTPGRPEVPSHRLESCVRDGADRR
jgi:hypothetical protein